MGSSSKKKARIREQKRRTARNREKVRPRLERALDEGIHVRVVSRHPDSDPVEGFVVALGQRWAVIGLLDDARRPDGWDLVRLRDVAAVERRKNSTIERRILEARGEWPLPAPEGLGLDRARELTNALVERGELVHVHVEGFDTGAMWVGTPLTHVEGELELHELDAQGAWVERPTFFDVRAVTRYTLGSGYAASLALVAGPRPARQAEAQPERHGAFEEGTADA